MITTEGIRMDSEKVKAIIECPEPKELKRSTSIFRICQLLPKIHTRLFKGSITLDNINQKGATL